MLIMGRNDFRRMVNMVMGLDVFSVFGRSLLPHCPSWYSIGLSTPGFD